MLKILEELVKIQNIFPVIAVTLAFVTASSVLGTALRRVTSGLSSQEFRSFRVSFLGPPASGKTTSILAAFDQIGRLEQPGVARLRGENTIGRIESGRRMLNAGRFPDRTPEDESTVYRFDYKRLNPLLAQMMYALYGIPFQYRVEVADFAGEHVQSLFDSSVNITSRDVPDSFSRSADQNFLKWISESNKCIIFIDTEMMLSFGDLYIQDITTNYMAFWDRYLDIHADGLSKKTGTPVVVAFSKIDCLVKSSSKPNPVIVADKDHDNMVRHCVDKLSTLLDYFGRTSRSVEVLGFSVLCRDENGERLGVDLLAGALLPQYGTSQRLSQARSNNPSPGAIHAPGE